MESSVIESIIRFLLRLLHEHKKKKNKFNFVKSCLNVYFSVFKPDYR